MPIKSLSVVERKSLEPVYKVHKYLILNEFTYGIRFSKAILSVGSGILNFGRIGLESVNTHFDTCRYSEVQCTTDGVHGCWKVINLDELPQSTT